MDLRQDLRVISASSDIWRVLLDEASEALASDVGLFQVVDEDMSCAGRCRGEAGRASAELEPRRGPEGLLFWLHGY